jgi:molecular chaperone Hsp33
MVDHLVRGIALDGRVRFVAVDASATVEELRQVHDPSPTATAALGRLAVGALLLTTALEKLTRREPLLTIEVDGAGPAGKLVATASPAGWVRASIGNPLASSAPRSDGSFDVPAVIGSQGRLVVTRDSGIGTPYQGIVTLGSGEIAESLAQYLRDSEQSPAAVVLAVSVLRHGCVDHAGGYVVQLLPGVSDEQADLLSERVTSLGSLTSSLAAGEHPVAWLWHLFPRGFEILDTIPARFLCGCSQERVEGAVKLLGAGEIRRLLHDSRRQPTVLTCGFCRTEYTVTPECLAKLLLEAIADLKGLH